MKVAHNVIGHSEYNELNGVRVFEEIFTYYTPPYNSYHYIDASFTLQNSTKKVYASAHHTHRCFKFKPAFEVVSILHSKIFLMYRNEFKGGVLNT